MAKKVLDAKAKAKRQKMIAVGLTVAFVAVAGFQFPKMWKMMHPKPASQPTVIPTASAPPPNSPLPASLGGTSVAQPAAVTSPSAGGPTPSAGQLVAFDRFASKNPFVPQVVGSCDTDPTGSTPASACPTPSTGTTASTGSTVSAPTKKVVTKPAPAPAPSTVSPAPTQAVISVNGTRQPVAVGAGFPSATPTFVLRSLGRRTAKIGIAGGSLADGAPTVTLKLGKTLTLMNTADGTRYVLILVSVS